MLEIYLTYGTKVTFAAVLGGGFRVGRVQGPGFRGGGGRGRGLGFVGFNLVMLCTPVLICTQGSRVFQTVRSSVMSCIPSEDPLIDLQEV